MPSVIATWYPELVTFPRSLTGMTRPAFAPIEYCGPAWARACSGRMSIAVTTATSLAYELDWNNCIDKSPMVRGSERRLQQKQIRRFAHPERGDGSAFELSNAFIRGRSKSHSSVFGGEVSRCARAGARRPPVAAVLG